MQGIVINNPLPAIHAKLQVITGRERRKRREASAIKLVHIETKAEQLTTLFLSSTLTQPQTWFLTNDYHRIREHLPWSYNAWQVPKFSCFSRPFVSCLSSPCTRAHFFSRRHSVVFTSFVSYHDTVSRSGCKRPRSLLPYHRSPQASHCLSS